MRGGLYNFHHVIHRFGRIVYRFGYVVRFLQKFGGCSSRLGSFLYRLIGFLAECGDLLMGNCVLLDFYCRALYGFCRCFEVALDCCNSLHNGVELGGILELGNQDTHGLNKRLRHWLVYGGIDTDECLPEVCGMLTGVVGPCCLCHTRQRTQDQVSQLTNSKFFVLAVCEVLRSC